MRLRPDHLPLLPGLFVLALAATPAGAQDLLAVSSTDYLPRPLLRRNFPKLHDFNQDGLPDIVDAFSVLWNFGGVFREVRAPFTEHAVPLAFGDFDGDGRDDILDYRSGSLDRHGVSFVRTPFPTARVEFSFLRGSSVSQHAVGDFDGDGDLDIVFEDSSSFSPPTWVENLGAGNFQDATATRMPTTPLRLNAGPIVPTDFDGDGDLDLVAFDSFTAGLSVMVNQGGGVFAAPDSLPFSGVNARSILGWADVDQDGDLDLWVDGARLVLDQGNSYALAATQPLPLRNMAKFVVSGDIDNDGDLDAWLEARGSVPCGWYENQGFGQPFAERVSQGPLIRGDVNWVSLADLDGDGWLDVVADDGHFRIHRGQPSGRFVDIVRKPEAGLAYGDFDGDGLVDSLATIAPFTLEFRRNDGAGGYTSLLSSPSVAAVSIFDQADLDGDGDLDLLYLPASPINGIQVALNDGSGSFTAVALPPTLNTREASAFADVDGDGDPDLILAARDGFAGQVTRLLRNDGRGGFTVDANWTDPNLPRSSLGYSFHDADGDGDIDVVACGTNELRLLANDGLGNFTEVSGAFPARFPRTGQVPSQLRATDLEGDGDTDVLALYLNSFPNSSPTEYAAVFLNDGNGNHVEGQVFTEGTEGTEWITAAVGDLDEDGDPDLLVGQDSDVLMNLDFQITVLENDGRGRFVTSAKRITGERFLRSTRLLDVDGDGDLDAPVASDFRSVLTNQTIDLRLRFVPRVGDNLEIEVAQPDPLRSQSALFVIAPNLLPAPLVIPGIGVLTVDALAGAPQLVNTLSRGEPARLQLPVPNDPSLIGRAVFAQAVVSPQITPRLTAAIRVPIAF